MAYDTLTPTRPDCLHKLYGLTLASDYPFKNRFLKGSGRPDVWFRVYDAPTVPDDWVRTEPVYRSGVLLDDGEPLQVIYRMGEFDVVRFTHTVDFYLWADHIEACVKDPEYEYLVEILFLGEVLSLWLEKKGIAAIHASAIQTEAGVTGFLSTNKGGKSTLAASFMQQGNSLLTDDIMAVEECNGTFFCRPGYPCMRMWPDEAQFFLGQHEDLEIVHPWYGKRRVIVGEDGFGRFCGTKQPIKALYIPKRLDNAIDVTIEPVPPRDALIELVRNSFSISIVESLGLEVQRMMFFSRMVVQVPMRRLLYPSGFKNLRRVNEAILEDLAGL
jgi:hypothetical protein